LKQAGGLWFFSHSSPLHRKWLDVTENGSFGSIEMTYSFETSKIWAVNGQK
jgi:hypothetical protein